MSNEKKMFRIEGKRAALYCSLQPDKPLILLNNYSGDGESVVKAMGEIDAPDCNLLYEEIGFSDMQDYMKL